MVVLVMFSLVCVSGFVMVRVRRVRVRVVLMS